MAHNITVEKIMALRPCYSRERVEELCAEGINLETLMTIPYEDARWLVSNLMNYDQLIEWSKECANRAIGPSAATASVFASRAAGFAAYCAAASCAADAARAARYAASCAANASWAANYGCIEEHKLSMKHACELLGVV